MKTTPIFRLLLLVIFSLNVSIIQSQVMEPNNDKTSLDLYEVYTLKQKRNKTAAWIMLGGGVVMTLVGITLNSEDEVATMLSLGLVDVPKSHEGDWLIVLGSATTVGSIPLFTAAAKNKRKANLELKRMQGRITDLTFDKANYLCLSLTISLE